MRTSVSSIFNTLPTSELQDGNSHPYFFKFHLFTVERQITVPLVGSPGYALHLPLQLQRQRNTRRPRRSVVAARVQQSSGGDGEILE